MRFDEILARFPDAKKSGDGWAAKCPAHLDGSPSLSICEGSDGRTLLYDHAGCTPQAICDAVGLTLADLFPPRTTNAAPPAKPRIVATGETFNWQKCVANFSEADAQKLAAWRGLSIEFVRWLHAQGTVGIFEGKIAFANHGDGGVVVSAHIRLEIGKWIYKPAGQKTAPLIFGNPKTAGFVMVFESQFDAFAVMDKFGWHTANGLPDTAVLITRGAGNGKLIAGQLSPDAVCYAFKQNDEPTPKKPIPAADVWLTDIASNAGCKVLNVTTPAPHKDCNDWTRAGATKSDLDAAVAAAKLFQPPDAAPIWTPQAAQDPLPGNDDPPEPTTPQPPEAKSLGDLQRRTADDPNELLRTGYLCRCAGLLIAAPSGIGKSAFAIMAMILWAIGRAIFGITPVRPLKSLLIQAENDDGDLAEMRDGVIAGMDLTDEEKKMALENVIVVHENTRTGRAFFDYTVAPLLELHRPDLLWIDPALAYLGGDVSSQKDVGNFLRNLLNPLLSQFNCGCVVIHHTNKPSKGEEKCAWQAGDFAYLGSGSAEWANWARAVLAIRSVGSHEVFELRAGKRGGRIGWKDEDGKTSFARLIGHATEPGVICWRTATEDETPAGKPRRAGTREDLTALVPLEKPVAKALLIDQWKDHYGNKDKGRAFLDSLIADGKLFEWRLTRPGTNAAKLICRKPQQAE
jgi:hypothetical protein